VVSPYYDSLLFKTTAWSRSFEDAIRKSLRSLKEFKISGIKTNVDFLINVLNNPIFAKGECNTSFIETEKELFNITTKADPEYNILKFIGDLVVNQTHGVKTDFDVPVVPKLKYLKI
jgi:pyruvate carboxylase